MIKHNNTYDYGECEFCDTPLEEQYIKQDFWLRGELIVVEHVRAGVCPRCGAKVVNAEVGQQILTLLEDARRIAAAPRLAVPILDFEQFPAHAMA
jgi:YgiT-type zinc finger domain-containing protein